MIRRPLRLLAVVGAWLSLSAFTPGNVECIAPADPGGGWDFTCRTVSKLLYDQKLVPEPVKVTNMPGGVGAVAWSNVASKRNDDPNLLVATSTVGITQIAQGRYPGGVDDMRWLAMLGADVGVIAVSKDSKYQTLKDLLDALKADPTVASTAGSSGIGGWDHIRLLLLAKAAGVSGPDLRKIRWAQFDGGGPAVTQMMGGHVDVVSTDLGEIAGFVESGDIRILAVLSEDRLPAEDLKDLPTAREQGYDVVGYNWRGFYLPGNVDDEAHNAWVDVMKKLYESDEWQKTAVSHGLTPIFRGGDEFVSFVEKSEDQMAEVSREIGVIK
jgi:putative tricarboxylic transport membrane protein